jgi:hypothetical protein
MSMFLLALVGLGGALKASSPGAALENGFGFDGFPMIG